MPLRGPIPCLVHDMAEKAVKIFRNSSKFHQIFDFSGPGRGGLDPPGRGGLDPPEGGVWTPPKGGSGPPGRGGLDPPEGGVWTPGWGTPCPTPPTGGVWTLTPTPGRPKV